MEESDINELELRSAKLKKLYEEVDDFGEVGFVTFLDDELKFSAEGKYACVKNFNDYPGYHFAFRIVGKELVCQPEYYVDYLNYQKLLFKIEIAYFTGVKLAKIANENGVYVEDISNLEGKTVKIMQRQGYSAQISTTEWDDIDCGEITFETWNDEERIIRFKFLSAEGTMDVLVGKVRLSEDLD